MNRPNCVIIIIGSVCPTDIIDEEENITEQLLYFDGKFQVLGLHGAQLPTSAFWS